MTKAEELRQKHFPREQYGPHVRSQAELLSTEAYNAGVTDGKETTYAKSRSLIVDEASNVPCTAELEKSIHKLISYFERRARENERRAEKHEANLNTPRDLYAQLQSDRSGYYFSGKADSYKRAAEKLAELVNLHEEWIVEVYHDGVWSRSKDKLAKDTYASLKKAQEAVVAVEKRYNYTLSYKTVRIK